MKKSRIKGNTLFYQSAGAFVAGILLVLAAFFVVDPEERGNTLYNPREIEGLVLYLGLFLAGVGLIIGLVSYLFGPVKPPEEKK